ncbi:MAG TPA: cell division protein FtsB [Burkholderiaceae bacterium]|mgnify:CR=1 FL=1|nr:cell division protein FtsB [Burkholderiaceae bacterium]
MRWWLLLVTALLIMIQWPLWFGKGGWLRVHQLREQLAQQMRSNEGYAAENDALAAEIQSLRDGQDAVQERARLQLNMVGKNEVFFQVVPQKEKNTDGQ